MARNINLGELEETVLTIVAILEDQDAYGNTVVAELKRQLNRDVSLSAIHTTLHRLEGKGLLDSSLGGATDRRGGRRKRMYHVTKVGYRSLEVMKEQRITLWKMVPRLKFNP